MALHDVAARLLAEHEAAKSAVKNAALLTFPEFAAHCRIKTKSQGVIQFRPEIWHSGQRRFQAERTGRDLVLKGRQIGISTLELLRGLQQSATRPSWNTVAVGHDRHLILDLFDIVHFAAEGLLRDGYMPAFAQDTQRMLRFANIGSQISVTEAGATERSASKKGHSGTIHRLHCTEVSRWNEPEATLTGLLAAVPANGEIVIESTANGVGGWFHDAVMECRDGKGPYKLHFFPWFEHGEYRSAVPADFDPGPTNDTERMLRGFRCDDAQIAWWRATVNTFGLDVALEQYPPTIDLAFRLSGGAYFPQDALDRAAARVREPIAIEPITHERRTFGQLLVYAHPRPNRGYVVGADVSEGIGEDGHAVCVIDHGTAETVATFWSDSIEPGDLGTVLAIIGQRYNGAVVAPERNNNGHATVRVLATERGYANVYKAQDERHGWVTNAVTRPVMFDDLLRGVREGAYHTPDAGTHAELTTVVVGPDGKPRARGKGSKGGAKDDRVVAWAIALQVRQTSGDIYSYHGNEGVRRERAVERGEGEGLRRDRARHRRARG